MSSGRHPDAAYFETVLRGAPSTDPLLAVGAPIQERTPGDWHFSNLAQRGHARGTAFPGLGTFVEELQADPLETLGNIPQLRDVYGQLGRMVLDRAAAADLPAVAFPSARLIQSVRSPQHAEFYKQVYDRDLAKQLYEPLAKRGLEPRYSARSGWWKVPLSPEVREAIRSGQSGLLDYRRGGLASLRGRRG